jgi:hypothetical protein
MPGQRNDARSSSLSRARQLFDGAKDLARYWNATAVERTAECPATATSGVPRALTPLWSSAPSCLPTRAFNSPREPLAGEDMRYYGLTPFSGRRSIGREQMLVRLGRNGTRLTK